MNNPLQMLSGSRLTMSSTEIAELTGKRHSDVLESIRKVLNEVDIDSAEYSAQYKDSTGRALPCFNLPRRECDLVIAGYSAKYRLAIIDRWQELENQSAKPILDLRDQKQLSAIALQLIEINQEQAKQIEILEPKANALDRLRSAEGSIAISDAAKIVGIKRDEFFASLNRIKWIFKRNGVWLGYEKARAKGLVDHRPVEAHGKVRTQCVITPKGLSEIAVMLDMGDAV